MKFSLTRPLLKTVTLAQSLAAGISAACAQEA